MGARTVDWDRYLSVESRASSGSGEAFTPLGDPARWGGQVETIVQPTGTFRGQQLIRVQTIDPYAHAWQMLGTLQAALDVWAADAASWRAELEVLMGAGQATVQHVFDLRALVALAAPFYVSPDGGLTRPWIISGGLCGRALSARVVHVLATETFAAPRAIVATALITPLAAGSGI